MQVTRENDSSGTATVHYKTVDGTAKGSSDFTAIPDTVLTFNPGETSKSINIYITGDDGLEPDETFKVELSNVQGAVLGNITATVTIKNDDTGLIVTTLADSENANDKDNSLREAITTANTKAGADTITFVPNLNGAINLTKALPNLTESLTITGQGANIEVMRDTGGNYRIFTVGGSSVNLVLDNLKISNGQATQGGGIYSVGGLTLDFCTISGNTATSEGGGIYHTGTGTLVVTRSTISGNTASGTEGGGGIFNDGTLIVGKCTISGNSAISGGGLFNFGSGQITNSTISGNRASGTPSSAGGGITSLGTLSVSTCTISGNTAVAGGGIENFGALTLNKHHCRREYRHEQRTGH